MSEQILITIIGGITAVFSAWLGNKVRSNSGAARHSAASQPDWQAFTDRLLANQEHLETEVSRLQQSIGALESRIDALKAKYWQAIGYIRVWHSRFPEEELVAPEAIRDDI